MTMVVSAIVLIALLWQFLRSAIRSRRGAAHAIERRQMPRELRDATLAYSEHLFRCETPRPWVARVDQVYRTAQGLHILVDSKTRKRASASTSDVIELSVQSMALRSAVAVDRIATWAWVRIVLPDGRIQYRRVELMDESALVDLDQRYRTILAGQRDPRPAAHPGMCRVCAFRSRCDKRRA